MIDLLIFHLHIVGIVYAYTKRWQEDGVKSGLLAVVLCGLVFVIIWSLMGPLARLMMSAPTQPGALFTVDTLSLVLTMIPETFFFWRFFLWKSREQNTRNRFVE
ncbi:MAG: hypothetical protein HYX66_08715 [Ignavibacteria bacterium]|nr:hypothetical protein [Ignavibacteria bacterium]